MAADDNGLRRSVGRTIAFMRLAAIELRRIAERDPISPANCAGSPTSWMPMPTIGADGSPGRAESIPLASGGGAPPSS